MACHLRSPYFAAISVSNNPHDVSTSYATSLIHLVTQLNSHSAATSLQVFDVVLNRQHLVVPNLDIFAKVGGAAAHDEIVTFSVEKGQLLVGGETSDFGGVLSVEFAKVHTQYTQVMRVSY